MTMIRHSHTGGLATRAGPALLVFASNYPDLCFQPVLQWPVRGRAAASRSGCGRCSSVQTKRDLLSNCYRRLVVAKFAKFRDFPLPACWTFGKQHSGGQRSAQELKEGVMGLGWRASRSFAGPLVGGAVFLNRDAQCVGDRFGVLVGKRVVGPFDSLDRDCGYVCGYGELRLGQAFHDAPVAGIAVVDGDEDDRLDGCVQDCHDAREDVDLRRSGSSFPMVDGADSNVGHASKVADAEAGADANGREFLSAESAQYAAAHAAARICLMDGQTHRILRES